MVRIDPALLEWERKANDALGGLLEVCPKCHDVCHLMVAANGGLRAKVEVRCTRMSMTRKDERIHDPVLKRIPLRDLIRALPPLPEPDHRDAEPETAEQGTNPGEEPETPPETSPSEEEMSDRDPWNGRTPYTYADGTPYATKCCFCGKPLPHNRTLCNEHMTDYDRMLAAGDDTIWRYDR